MGDTITHPGVIQTEAEVTVYPWWDQVPANLATKTQLAEAGLKPGKGIKPAAVIRYGRGRRERRYDLFDRATAVPKRPPTAAQLAALEKAQTALRTCKRCGKVVERRDQLLISSDDYHNDGLWSEVGCCIECEYKAERAYHARSRDSAIAWARDLAARPDGWCVLDTETAGLYGSILEVSVVGPDGEALFDSLVRPDWFGPDSDMEGLATEVHGITPAMVAAAPPLAEILPALQEAIRGRLVVVYNLEYDTHVLDHDIMWLEPRPDAADVDAQLEWCDRRSLVARRWLKAAQGWDCAMEWNAQYRGQWRQQSQDYTYPPLSGGHRAAGDCREVLALIGRMAASPLTSEKGTEVKVAA